MWYKPFSRLTRALKVAEELRRCAQTRSNKMEGGGKKMDHPDAFLMESQAKQFHSTGHREEKGPV